MPPCPLRLIGPTLRAVLLSEPHDPNHSGQLKVAQQRLTTLSKKESTHWSFVVATVPSQELTSSDQNGQISLKIYTCKVYIHATLLIYLIFIIHIGKITTAQLELHYHLRLVGLVGSIDNDMSLTDLTIGAPTAVKRICEAIDNINSTAYSHSRAFVVEVMGRDCGWLALQAGVA